MYVYVIVVACESQSLHQLLEYLARQILMEWCSHKGNAGQYAVLRCEISIVARCAPARVFADFADC